MKYMTYGKRISNLTLMTFSGFHLRHFFKMAVIYKNVTTSQKLRHIYQ